MLLKWLNSAIKRTKTARRLSADIETIKAYLATDSHVKMLPNGAKFHLPDFFNDYIQNTIMTSSNFFEIELLEKLDEHLTEGSVILDIGANIGNHSVYWGYRHPGRKIYAFEPIGSTYSILRKNIEENLLQDIVQTFNFGISSKHERASVSYYNPTNIGGTQLTTCPDGSISLKPIDEVEIKNKVDFVKIDTEGFELEVLLGAKEMIGRDKPVIFIEIFQENRKKAQKTLNQLGYRQAQYFGSNNYLYLPIS